jgi:hypothetical protein
VICLCGNRQSVPIQSFPYLLALSLRTMESDCSSYRAEFAGGGDADLQGYEKIVMECVT